MSWIKNQRWLQFTFCFQLFPCEMLLTYTRSIFPLMAKVSPFVLLVNQLLLSQLQGHPQAYRRPTRGVEWAEQGHFVSLYLSTSASRNSGWVWQNSSCFACWRYISKSWVKMIRIVHPLMHETCCSDIACHALVLYLLQSQFLRIPSGLHGQKMVSLQCHRLRQPALL